MSRRHQSSSNVFARNAAELASHGLAVVPIRNKAPVIAGWNKWKGPPNRKALTQLIESFPQADIGFVPGPSNLLVVDIDDRTRAREVEQLCGSANIRVATSRGEHLYFRAPENTKGLPVSLRHMGLNVDLKHGGSIVACPPTNPYRYVVGNLHCLPNLGFPRLDWVKRGRGKEWPSSVQQAISRQVTEGQRAITLNKSLCGQVSFCDDFDDLLDAAHTENDDYLPPLDDGEVTRIAGKVWRDRGKLKQWIGRKDGREDRDLMVLMELDPRVGPDAFALLIKLRTEHAARQRRGEMFKLAIDNMVRAGVLPGFGRRRLERARDLLLEAGFIVEVFDRGPGVSGQYMLAPNHGKDPHPLLPTPS